MASLCNAPETWNIESLPNELLLHITSYNCTSQSSYRTLLLLNSRFHNLVQPDYLLQVPIRLNSSSVRPFYDFIVEKGFAGYIRYLWINGTSTLCSQIAVACSNLIALACSKLILYSICAAPSITHSFPHSKLQELTVFDLCDWNFLKTRPHGAALCRQITHLRLHDKDSIGLAAPDLFPSLTHFSCMIDRTSLSLAEVLKFPRLEHIVLTTFFWKNEPADAVTQKVFMIDYRVRILYFGSNELGEFQLWCGRARKNDCIWTRRPNPRKLI
ncbi:hypothetical protein M413DRAFT_363952 [Hebeloma cylindrosporum]|uniref:F-box domain-containing protein n=1 Tax=Hebeloma cylindrosporum TaxID=76867 RepID=A0A0C2YV00_HEBCY|nr:hypothetical protein M413DRAFT_363952 [Hebeloma cylindrosporum h7]